MRRQLIEQIERRRELKRKIREAVRASRRKKLLESIMSHKDVSRGRKSRLAERLHESRIRARRERLMEGLGRRRVIDGSRRRADESLDLENKLSRKSRIRALLRKRRDAERVSDGMEESRIERRRRIAERIERIRSRKMNEDETETDIIMDVPDELGGEGEELDVDLLLGESKEVKTDVKQLNESKRFQALINKYLSEGVLDEAKKDEDEKDEKDGSKKAKKTSIREKIKACRGCKK